MNTADCSESICVGTSSAGCSEILGLIYRVKFRDGANEGFHEAMGEIMAMNVATPEHLAAIDLLDNESNDPETDRQAMINFLLFQSLQQVATMPFTIMMENWRYAVFNGTFTEDQWMEKFWEMKNEWVGVKAPAERTEKCE